MCTVLKAHPSGYYKWLKQPISNLEKENQELTGIRVSEAINIKIKDFTKDGDAYIIQVRGKGNKPRVVMIKEIIIKNDLTNWYENKSCNENLLFCNQKGTRLTQAYIGRLVEQILLSVGLRKEKMEHIC